ncbi:MAG: aminomethyl-transferring glycine dehydrogenase subunit GcvPB [Thermoprotei archaeon]
MHYRQAVYSHSSIVNEPLLIELNQEDRAPNYIRKGLGGDVKLPEGIGRSNEPKLPKVSELTVVRHFTRLSQMNFGVDTGTYPLGSCTMKYNPKLNDVVAQLPGFAHLHPDQHASTVQGALHVLWGLQEMLKEITGMDALTLQPAAGAQGEYTGLLITRAYYAEKGELHKRRKVLIPDTAHGSNPASASMAGFEAVTVPSLNGEVDYDQLLRILGDDVAAFMVTVPNTLGIFESRIKEIAQEVHSAGALMYMDGANMNALVGSVKPSELGFDIVHLNLHKTFSTPHGGGGPGAGPVAVRSFLEAYLPRPRLVKKPGGEYGWSSDYPKSIGRIRESWGNFGVLVRAYAYILSLGREGLRQISRDSVLTSNYAAKRLRSRFTQPFSSNRSVKHEFVVSSKGAGVTALEVAKYVLKYGHAPTIYFPLIVPEALMIEFTESETKREIDEYVDGLLEATAAQSAQEPSNTSVSRLDEVQAARNPILNWKGLKAREDNGAEQAK